MPRSQLLARTALLVFLLTSALANTPPPAPVSAPGTTTGTFTPSAGAPLVAGGLGLSGEYSLQYSFPGGVESSATACGKTLSLSGRGTRFEATAVSLDGAACTGSPLTFLDAARLATDARAARSMLDKPTGPTSGNPGGLR